ncbi:sensor histidine kinase [Sunxiuqinia sp. A32]|uniref:sensor histidine kinase n=1 Tax=Sunxiuqinia sp. A32 TaxID=3461496 RepID=UPI0040453E8B
MLDQKKHTFDTFQLIVEASPNALILVNKSGNIEYVNAFTENLFLYSKKELTGATLETIIPNRFINKHNEYFQRFLKNPTPRQMGKGRDLFAVKKDGQEFPVEIGLNPIVVGNNPLILALIIDISERKKAEILLRKHSKELELKNKELEQFNSIASHDLQEPLNTIISWTDLLQHTLDLSEDDESTQMFGYITNAATRMKKLIHGLLEYSHLGRDAELKQVNCASLLESVEEDLLASIEKSNATLEISDLPTIWAYELELRLLFQNLISNSIKYRKESESPKITISAKAINDAWQFTVKDNGIGIEKEYHDKIFTIFQRIHPSETYEGSGIGLAHCRKIIDLHHGSIEIESESGKGSSFIFTIPDLKHYKSAPE